MCLPIRSTLLTLLQFGWLSALAVATPAIASGPVAPDLGRIATQLAGTKAARGLCASAMISRAADIAGQLACPATATLLPGDAVNAWADGARIVVGEGLLRRCGSNADLALIIAHEMAHNLLHHRQQLAALGVSADPSAAVSAATVAQVRETEEEADRLAVQLASEAGYDLSGAEGFLRGLLMSGRTGAATHPAPTRRLALLHIAIAAQRGRGALMANTVSTALVSGRIYTMPTVPANAGATTAS